MTSGTRVTDTRHPSTRLGLYSYRTWNGGDRPNSPPLYRDVPSVMWVRTPPISTGGRGGVIAVPHVRRVYIKRPKSIVRDLTDHDYSMSLIRNVDTDTRYKMVYLGQTQWNTAALETIFGHAMPVDYGWTASDDLQLLGKLREKVAGSSFNLGVALAEAPQALKMIANAARRIGSSLSLCGLSALYKERAGHLKERGFPPGPVREALAKAQKFMRDAARALGVQPRGKMVAGNWLELQYGWLPLVNDAYDGAQTLAHFLEGPRTMSVRVRTRRRLKVQSQSPTNCAFGKTDGAVHGQIIARLTEKDAVALVGLTDPLSVLWEKLPYSFVVDWFIPIGNFLQARALAGALKGTFVKTIYKWYRASKPYSLTAPAGIVLESNYVRNVVDLTRTVSTTLSVPLPEFKSLDKILSWRHTANAVALLIQSKTKLPLLAAFR